MDEAHAQHTDAQQADGRTSAAQGAQAGFIGVLDSGAGGISVLREMAALLPCEHFRFFGDSANAPYGDLGAERILELSRTHVGRMIAEGAKAIVIACNTATSAAAGPLRAEYPHIPIIGIEPALKPAALAGGRILVLATEATVHLDKYHDLAARYGAADIVTVPCSGLVELVEAGDLDDPRIAEYLHRKLDAYAGQIDRVVLGCTHYPFITRQIAEVLGDVEFHDGAAGTAHQLQRRLEEAGLCAPAGQQGSIQLASSLPEKVSLYERLFHASPS